MRILPEGCQRSLAERSYGYLVLECDGWINGFLGQKVTIATTAESSVFKKLSLFADYDLGRTNSVIRQIPSGSLGAVLILL